MKKTCVELFAGVGGFRVGLERADKNLFDTVLANQWEPSKKAQDAFECYNSHFPSSEMAPIAENGVGHCAVLNR